VLSGAGISLAAGIPTYRDEKGDWKHSEPIKHQEFVTQESARQRYWARSMRGWPMVGKATPTAAHGALAALERCGKIDTVITQNVDRLHQRAGSQRVIDLHGRLDRVLCMDCGNDYPRTDVQRWMSQSNGWVETSVDVVQQQRPDGDVDVSESLEQIFSVPHCPSCSGPLIPDVVFFGGTVPRARVEECMAAIERADALVAVGSSLQVFSGFRFCRKAAQLGKPIAILNPGVTRADAMAQLKLGSDCQMLLPAMPE